VTRVVIDTSVFVSALIGKHGSAPAHVLRAFAEDKLAVVVCPGLLDELERVLARPKIRRYVDEANAREYVERIRLHATVVDDPDSVPVVTRDPADDYIVALARQEHVDAIVSVDLDLLDACPQDLPVWTPRQLVEALPRREQDD
jgi:putative PIN family toxin of toxin-antitoxin system